MSARHSDCEKLQTLLKKKKQLNRYFEIFLALIATNPEIRESLVKKLRLINARTMRFDEHFARLVVVFEEIFAAFKAGRDLRSTSCSYLVFDRPLTIV